MGNPQLTEFVSQLQTLPSRPHIYDLVETELFSDTPSIDKIGEAASQDIGLSTKLLQLTNASFFGDKGEIMSAKEAVQALGHETLRQLFKAGNVFSRCDTGVIGSLDLERLHMRGISVGNFAMRIASLEGLPILPTQTCSSMGLLCRLGCIILSMFTPESYSGALTFGEECEKSVALEIELFGTSHSEVGGYLLGLWGLPNQMVDAAAHHHECNCLESKNFSVLTAIQIAEQLASGTHYEKGGELESFDTFLKLRDRTFSTDPNSVK